MRYQVVTKCFTLAHSYWDVNEQDVALRAISETSIILFFFFTLNPIHVLRNSRATNLSISESSEANSAHLLLSIESNTSALSHPQSTDLQKSSAAFHWPAAFQTTVTQNEWGRLRNVGHNSRNAMLLKASPKPCKHTHSRSDTYACFHKSRHVEAPSVLLMKFGVGKYTLGQECINTRLPVWH